MEKPLVNPEEIIEAINEIMSISDALDGDCRECNARRIGRVTDEEEKQLGRDWNVDMISGECKGECSSVLVQAANEVGRKFDAIWE